MAKSVTQDGAATIGAGDSVTPPPSTSVDIKSMSDEDFAAYEAGRKKYGELAAKSKAEAGKKSEAQFVKDYGSYLYSKPMEEFKPSQETAAGFAALGSLMMVAGSLFGGSGRLAGIGAMNNIAGMVKGYQQGRKDLYEQERQQFEENMKVQERNRADIKEAFNLALKMAPTDLRGAEEFMGKVFMSKGMNIPHEMMKTSGLTHTASVVLGAADKADQISKQVSAQIGSPTTPAGLPPIGAKLTPQQEIQFAQETARRAARAKDEKGAQEWVSVDGKTDRMTRQEVDAARGRGQNVQYIPTPSSKSEAAVDKEYVQNRAKRIASYLEKPLSTWDRRKADGQEIEKILARDYPQYDEKKYATRTAAQKAFAVGKEAATSRSLEVVFDHLATLDDLNDARNAGDIQRFNRIAANWASQFGATAPTNFETAVSQIGAEVTKAIGGAGYTGALADREEARNSFDLAKTPEQVTGAIAVVKRLVGGQLKGIGDQYERTTGEKFVDSNILPETILKDMGWTSRIFKDGKSSESTAPASATTAVPDSTKSTEKPDPATLPPATKNQIAFTAKKYGKTEEQIKDMLRSQGRKIEGE